MPAHPSVLLHRHRLHDLLDQSVSRLTVISGPSGFGKTSLVRAWAETSTASDLVWVTLESDLDSRAAFWQTVLAGVGRAGLVGRSALALASEIEESDDPAAVLARGFSLCRTPLLVVDAYERLRTTPELVDADLARLAQLVPQLRIVVTTRTSSGLASPARSLRGEVQLLNPRDLAFTLAETADLLGAFAAPMPDAAASRLHRATRGYPLALRAALLSSAPLDGSLPSPPSAELDGWQRLVAEDLRIQLQQRSAYDFVLATSVPPYFDADLAVALAPQAAEPARVKEILDDLEWHGFGRWIPFAPGTQVFQYVESLREVMLVEVRGWSRPDQVRAAESSAIWLASHGGYEAALEMAVGAGLFGVAAWVYAGVVGTNQDAVSSNLVNRHLTSVPSKALINFPALAFGRGLACFRDPSLRGAAAEFFKISAEWERPKLASPTLAHFLLGHLARTVSLRLLGRSEESARAALRALHFNDAVPAAEREVVADLQPMVLRNLAYSLYLEGDLAKAREVASRAIATAAEATARNHSIAHALGMSAFEGWVDQARSVQAQLDPGGWRPGEECTHVNAAGRIGEAILSLDTFDHKAALARFEGCGVVFETTEFWPLHAWVRLHAQLGLGNSGAEARKIAEQLQRRPMPPCMTDNLASAAVGNALAIAWLAAGNGAKAAALLRRPTRFGGQLAPAALLAKLAAGDADAAWKSLAGQESQPGHTARSRAATLTLGAAAAHRLGHQESAIALLERAVAQVGATGARLHLAYLPTDDLVDLRALAARRGSADLQAHLAIGVPAAFETASNAVVTLSEKERAVVAAMVEHPTRSAIAAALHISENTVKTHLQRIYRKLGVNSQAAVLERAVELDLLDAP
ncbi:LuxR C-terminal-related transcriptional regulator [Nocardioides sp. Bht2]|uniref:helix-turn-helix transcriptional regulator n=1 Tax=Nocardioides sp. Bht2 TaxID=3392297 RepID=UPI0039B3C06D